MKFQPLTYNTLNTKYSNFCPNCRTELTYEKIYYISDNNDNQIILDCEVLDELGTKMRTLLLNIKNYKKILVIGNFDDGLVKVQNILNQLNIKNILTKNEKKIDDMDVNIYLSNYSEDFLMLKNKIKPEIVFCLEPYYSQDFKIKMYDIFEFMGKPIIKFLLIKNTIEDEYLNRMLDNTIESC